MKRTYIKDGKIQNSDIFKHLSQTILLPVLGQSIEWDATSVPNPVLTIGWAGGAEDTDNTDTDFREKLGAAARILWTLGVGEDMCVEELPTEEGVMYKYTITIKKQSTCL